MAEKLSLAKLREATRSRDDGEDFSGDGPGDQEAGLPHFTTSEPGTTSAPASALPRPSGKPSSADRVHTSVYLPRDAWRRLRAIAAAEDCKVHDLVMEGVGEVIARRS